MAEHDVLADLREALDKLAAATSVILVHPDHETAARAAVAASPFPGLLKVTVSEHCPRARVFLMPKPAPFLDDDQETDA